MRDGRENRTRAGNLEEWIARLDSPTRDGPDSFVGVVVNGGSSFPAYYAVQPIALAGNEAEGVAPTKANIDTPIPVAFYDRAPSAGSLAVAVWIGEGSRWVALRKKSAGQGIDPYRVDIPNCFCQHSPATLIMTSDDPECNYRMFQSCVIQWQARPAVFDPLNLATNIYLSTQSFPDPIAGGAEFYYYLICHLNQYSLTRLYPTSPYGSPYRDALLYTWLLGGYGNTCDPFHLDEGTAFPGSDITCSVRIDAG